MYHQHWHDRLSSVIEKPLNASTFAAFNVCIDAIVHFSPSHLSSLEEYHSSVEIVADVKPQLTSTPAEFLTILVSAIGRGRSLQCIATDGLADWFDATFPDRSEAVGGQAGIIANLMDSLKAGALLYAPMMSKRQAAFFSDGVRFPVVVDGALTLESVPAAASVAPTKVNWIFEYKKGDSFELNGEQIVCPRDNRVIFATRPNGLTMAFGQEYAPVLPDLARSIEVGFMAGYHNVAAVMPDGRSAAQYIGDEEASLKAMTEANPALHLHLEYVTPKSVEHESHMLKAATKYIKSFGINENEIKLVLDRFGKAAELDDLRKCECSATLYRAGKALIDALGVDRVHIHNLGYYVMVCRKTSETTAQLMAAQVEGCLYAAAAVAVKAMHGGFATPQKLLEVRKLGLSEIGFKQMAMFAEEYGLGEEFLQSGLVDRGDHYVIITPAFVVDKPVSTVGMGDTISSTSFAYEISAIK